MTEERNDNSEADCEESRIPPNCTPGPYKSQFVRSLSLGQEFTSTPDLRSTSMQRKRSARVLNSPDQLQCDQEQSKATKISDTSNNQ